VRRLRETERTLATADADRAERSELLEAEVQTDEVELLASTVVAPPAAPTLRSLLGLPMLRVAAARLLLPLHLLQWVLPHMPLVSPLLQRLTQGLAPAGAAVESAGAPGAEAVGAAGTAELEGSTDRMGREEDEDEEEADADEDEEDEDEDVAMEEEDDEDEGDDEEGEEGAEDDDEDDEDEEDEGDSDDGRVDTGHNSDHGEDTGQDADLDEGDRGQADAAKRHGHQEGLQLLPSAQRAGRASSGYKGVHKMRNGKFWAWESQGRKTTGFLSAEEAALAFAQFKARTRGR